MAQTYTTTDLIASVKNRGMIPTSQNTFLAADFLRFGTEEIQTSLVPTLLSVREEYYVTFKDSLVLVDKDLYEIPERAIGRSLRDVLWSSSAPITLQSEINSVARLEPDQIPHQRNVSRSTNDFMFFMRDDYVGVSPAPRQNAGTLRMLYHRRPSNLVEVAEAAKIISIDSTTQVTVDAIPGDFTTGKLYDLVKATGGFVSLGDDLAVTTVDTVGVQITFSADLPSGLSVGDYIAEAGETPVPQIPLELTPVLAQKVVVKCLEALGDREGAQLAQAKAAEIEKAAMVLITPRMRGEARKVMAVNYYKNSYWG